MKQFIYRCLAVCWLTLCLTPPAFAALAHRYSFTEDVSDSIGAAHGALMGNASITNGEVVLRGTAGGYVELPGGIITGFEAVTIECWAKFNASGNWARLYDFGDKNGANGRNYILLTPHSGSADTRMSISDTDPGSSNERFVILPGVLDNKPLLHVTAVYDPANGFAGLYTNGVLAASRDDLDIPLSSVKNVFSYIGRSLYSSDAYLNARITEFRIYDQALSASDIALSFQLGTNTPANHGPAAIATQPQDKAVNELQPVTFTVGALGTAPRALQWYKNDAPIAGATNASYTVEAAPASDNGARFKAIVGNTFSNVAYSVTSSSAVLTVNSDMTPPTLLRAANFSPTQVDVAFSEAVRPGTATDLRHYVLTSSSGPVSITGAVLNPDQSSVLLTTAPLTTGTLYTLTVNGVRDVSAAANAIAPDAQATFTAQTYTIVDIGNPIPGGTATAAGGGYDVVAGGRDILGASDQFSLLSIQRTGDFDVKVQVPGLGLSDAFAKAGLMARELTNSNSRYAATFATPSVAGTFFQARLANAGGTTNLGSLPVSYPDTWLRLRRAGNVFSGYAGFDGNRWTLLGSATIAMSNTVYFGMAVASRNTNQTTTAQFRKLENATDATVGQIALTGEPLGPSSRKTGLAISEIMYHPRTVPGSIRSLEFVEVFNSQAFWEDIGGYRLTGSIDYTFPTKTVIPAGGFLVVARDPEFVRSHYGITGVLGPWVGAIALAVQNI